MIQNAFHLESVRGGTLRGDVRMREGPPPRTAIVVAHGFKGFKDWGFFPHLCSTLAVEGHAVISFNFSHNGIGDDSESFSKLEAFSRNTLSREVDELNQLLATVAAGELTPRRPREIGLLGHSRGGGISIIAASENPAVDALVTWGAIDHLDRWTEATLAEWKRDGVTYVVNQRTGQHLPLSIGLWEDHTANQERLDLTQAAQAVRTPWLIVHGKDDLTVPMEEAETLARRSGKARLHLVEGAGHTFETVHPFAGASPALREAMAVSLQHFKRHLVEP